jgi:hypothetical protein
MKAMTAAEFVSYWTVPDESGMSLLDENQENLAEREAQYASECAMFGDAGPGQGLTIRECRAEIAKVEARLKAIKG